METNNVSQSVSTKGFLKCVSHTVFLSSRFGQFAPTVSVWLRVLSNVVDIYLVCSAVVLGFHRSFFVFVFV